MNNTTLCPFQQLHAFALAVFDEEYESVPRQRGQQRPCGPVWDARFREGERQLNTLRDAAYRAAKRTGLEFTEVERRVKALAGFIMRMLLWPTKAGYLTRGDGSICDGGAHQYLIDVNNEMRSAWEEMGALAVLAREEAEPPSDIAPSMAQPDDPLTIPPEATVPSSPEPPTAYLEQALWNLPATLADMDSARAVGPLPQGCRVVCYSTLVSRMGERHGHGRAACEWAIHWLARRRMLTLRYSRGEAPSVRTREGVWFGGDQYVIYDLCKAWVGSTPALWDWWRERAASTSLPFQTSVSTDPRTRLEAPSPPPDTLATLKVAAKTLRLKGNEAEIINRLCSSNGRVPLADLAVECEWTDPETAWNPARVRLNKKLKKHGWALRTEDKHAVAVPLPTSARK